MPKRYKPPITVVWCPHCRSVLANQEVVGGRCRRCGTNVGVEVGVDEEYVTVVQTLLTKIGQEENRIQERLSSVRHQITLVSGNGGVGKSALTANLAVSLAEQGFRVGMLDADLSTPSLAPMLGVPWQPVQMSEAGVTPLVGPGNIQLMSIASFLPEDEFKAVKGEHFQSTYVWEGVSGAKVLRDLLSNTAWGELDLLLVDLPQWHDLLPTVAQFLPQLQAVVVTIPLEAYQKEAGNCLNRLRQLNIAPLGVVENMVGYYCLNCVKLGPLCGRTNFCQLMWRESSSRPAPPTWRHFTSPYSAQELSQQWGLPYWGSIPFDPRLQRSTAKGKPVVLAYPRSPSARATVELAQQVGAWLQAQGGN